MSEQILWEKEIKNPIAKIVIALLVVMIAFILIVVAGITFVASKIFEKIDSKNKNKRPL